MSDKTAEERIEQHLASRVEHIQDMQRRLRADDTYEEADEERFEFPLSVDTRRTVVIHRTSSTIEPIQEPISNLLDYALIVYVALELVARSSS